ncbi:MAG: class I SAM-dependent methyltransferase [Candidatus Staskawiczbacteria bacterium]|nr:class I SAM-dependent methyltransferase [Candidatus Staskawiczbacteria bacterium]
MEKFISDNFKKPLSALDFGHGKGHDVACLKGLGWNCEGFDIKSGVDLQKPFYKGQYDLIYSNYVLQFVKDKNQFVDNIYNNLKKNGFIFLLTFDKSDKSVKNGIEKNEISELLKNFNSVNIKKHHFFDNDFGHKHWHVILEVTAKK